MDRGEFLILIKALNTEAAELFEKKGADYAGSVDIVRNFKSHGERLELPAEMIWAVYASKHWDAVMSYCREGQVESEPIQGRVLDLIVYLYLLMALIVDKERGGANEQ